VKGDRSHTTAGWLSVGIIPTARRAGRGLGLGWLGWGGGGGGGGVAARPLAPLPGRVCVG